VGKGRIVGPSRSRRDLKTSGPVLRPTHRAHRPSARTLGMKRSERIPCLRDERRNALLRWRAIRPRRENGQILERNSPNVGPNLSGRRPNARLPRSVGRIHDRGGPNLSASGRSKYRWRSSPGRSARRPGASLFRRNGRPLLLNGPSSRRRTTPNKSVRTPAESARRARDGNPPARPLATVESR
jgi:hypothetical protein